MTSQHEATYSARHPELPDLKAETHYTAFPPVLPFPIPEYLTRVRTIIPFPGLNAMQYGCLALSSNLPAIHLFLLLFFSLFLSPSPLSLTPHRYRRFFSTRSREWNLSEKYLQRECAATVSAVSQLFVQVWSSSIFRKFFFYRLAVQSEKTEINLSGSVGPNRAASKVFLKGKGLT